LPTLSFHRAQEIIEMIHYNQDNGGLPSNSKVIIDAPLAEKVLENFKNLDPGVLSSNYGEDTNYYKTDEESRSRFNLNNSTSIKTHEASIASSKALYEKPNTNAIILASGGMGGYGRAVNYLRGDFSRNPKNSIIFSCYQVEGTEGANLVKRINHGDKARVVKIEGFTSHIAGEEVFKFLGRFNLENLKNIIIVHGKDKTREKMAEAFYRRKYPQPILSKIGENIFI
jgi:predicted metal-dependent RNase